MIALHGGYYFDNFGDVLLFLIFKNWIDEEYGETIAYPMVPQSNRERFSGHIPGAAMGLGTARQWEALIFAGGGHFAEPELKTWKRKWNLFFFRNHVLLSEWFIQKKLPYAVIGVGAGPISSPFARAAARRIFNHAEVVSVRDEESEHFLRSDLNVNSKIAAAAPDPAVLLSKQDIPPDALAWADDLLRDFDGKIFLGIHQTDSFLKTSPQSSMIREKIIAALKSSPDVVPVIFTDYGQKNPSDSSWFSEGVSQKLNRPVIFVPFPGVWKTVALISKLQALMTPKLHVGIVAYGLGKYVESFGTDPKIPRFYRQIKRPDQCMMISKLTETTCQEKIERVIRMAKAGTSAMDQTWHQIKEDALIHKQLTLHFLNRTLRNDTQHQVHDGPVAILHQATSLSAHFSFLNKEIN